MEIKLPKLGEGADSGTIVSVMVKVGDTIKKDQNIIELENEKAIAPIPATEAGVVTQIFVKEGQKISVGQRILSVGEAGAAVQAAPPAQAAPAARPAAKRTPVPVPDVMPFVAPATTATAGPGPILESPDEDAAKPAASPVIRKLARELGIDLARIRGSERGGRIVMDDVKAYIERLQEIAFSHASPAAAPAPEVAPSAPSPTPTPSIDFAQFGPITRTPLTSLRKTIARRMHESWTAIPQVTQFDDADITGLNELRKKYAAAYEAKGARLTLTPFTLKAVVTALKQSPIFNASLDEATNEIVFKNYYHIGMAVDTEAGLIVPVIRDVDKKSLLELSVELQALAEKTRSRKISGDDLKGGSFTISNQGGIGGAHFTPIINRPEAAILGLGRSVLKPVVREGGIVPRMMMPVCVTYDHRLIDGGNAARFITQIVQALENFDEAQIKLS
jgi:pyruvate dehydrogenase E2 component (dihydrolipoamide acetyltransferase)